ncbi:MAG: hypothetical protein ACOX6Y_12870 [Christensenellales bacterium]
MKLFDRLSCGIKQDYKAWKNSQSEVMVKLRREVLGKPPSEEARYYVSSLKDMEKAPLCGSLSLGNGKQTVLVAGYLDAGR